MAGDVVDPTGLAAPAAEVAARQRSPATRRTYAAVYRTFGAFLGLHATAADLTAESVRAHRDQLERAGRSPATLAKHLSALRGLAEALAARALPRPAGAVLRMPDRRSGHGNERFPTPDKPAAAAGLAPVLRQSGKVRYLKRAHGGNKALKRVLFQSAFCTLTHPDSKAFYRRKRDERNTHHEAVLALARRRGDVLHANPAQPHSPPAPTRPGRLTNALASDLCAGGAGRARPQWHRACGG